MFNVRTKAAGGQSDNRHDTRSAVIPSMWICFPWENGFSGFIHYVNLIHRMSSNSWLPGRSHTVFSLTPSQRIAVNVNSVVCVFVHLQDPLRVLQGLEEGVLRVGRGGAGSTGSQQLFERGLHLPRVCKVHRHQFTVERGVHSEALSQEREQKSNMSDLKSIDFISWG